MSCLMLDTTTRANSSNSAKWDSRRSIAEEEWPLSMAIIVQTPVSLTACSLCRYCPHSSLLIRCILAIDPWVTCLVLSHSA